MYKGIIYIRLGDIMKKLLKNQYKDILLVLVYIIAAVAVYVMIANLIWGIWYVSLLIGVVISIIGAIIGYIYIKSIINAKK